MIKQVFISMRPRQWIKNLVVFGALLFVPGAVREGMSWLLASGAFAVFCLASGAIYLINDIVDRKRDALHPRKRNRPVASGALHVYSAIAAAAAIIIIALVVSLRLDTIQDKPLFAESFQVPYGLTITVASYIVLMVLYSYIFKNEIILDVLVLSIGFVLRAVAGGLALDVRISPWLLATTLFISLFLALGKRRGEMKELENGAGSHRNVLNKYSVPLIDSLLTVCAAANIMSYSLYTFLHDQVNIAGAKQTNAAQLMFTVPFVIYGIFRYLHLVLKHDLGATPDEVLTKDKRMMLCVGLWAITVLFMLSLR